MSSPTYFTCTLGEAAALNLTDTKFRNITAFVDYQASLIPLDHAVGFASPPEKSDKDRWDCSIFTFKELQTRSSSLACTYLKAYNQKIRTPGTVALLSPSTPEFLFSWLALMRIGLSVLLIAPQCQPAAIAQLCKATSCTVLIYDEQHMELASKAATSARSNGSELHAIPLLTADTAFVPDKDMEQLENQLKGKDANPDDIAYLHHTSGTSSGTPKPIAQTHRAGCGVLPHFPAGKNAATFTTTPLYHGGVADAFRAWTSGALIWLFPGKGVPITAKNIIRCLDLASEMSNRGITPPVKYFSSVPFVLQSLEADERGLQLLKNMDIVGVGGAALPSEIGDRLVDSNVNLISRFGSAECGFLMSSHRDYAKDRGWQYLRDGAASQHLNFESRADGLFELVISNGWPHMAKQNRKDGSFATNDLFTPHKSIVNAWEYHSRADSQLTLMTGKKFDPAPLEDAIATTDLLEDVVLFGKGRAFAGALLFRSSKAEDLSNTELVEQLWPLIQRLNDDSQDHARLAKKMLVPMKQLTSPLEKSSKGTVIRRAVEERFEQTIADAYSNIDDGFALDVADNDVLQALQNQIQSIVGGSHPPEENTDLYAYGVDSIASMRVRSGLSRLFPDTKTAIPMNIVDDCGTVQRLAAFVIDRRHGRDDSTKSDEEERQLMLELVTKYSHFDMVTEDAAAERAEAQTNGNAGERDGGDIVVLTGATGALGAHVLDLYRRDSGTRKIYCLVRGADDHACWQRVSKSLEYRGLGSLASLDPDKVVVLRSELGDGRLGLDNKDYARLASEATIILHAAWSVNFRMRLASFEKDNIAGLRNLLHLALRSTKADAPRFGFCSSVASVLATSSHKPVSETISREPSTATPMGYSRSKWVAEVICDNANKQSRLQGRVTVFRVGQLAGDSHRGVWNGSEAWPLMLSAVKLTGSLPELAGETLDWLPVDVAAAALLQGMSCVGSGVAETSCTTRVAHVVHPGPNPSWRQMLLWLRDEREFELVRPSAWVAALERAAEEAGSESAGHGAFKLLELWKAAYGNGGRAAGERRDVETGQADREYGAGPDFAMDWTQGAMPALRRVRAVDREYVVKLWRWIDENM